MNPDKDETARVLSNRLSRSDPEYDLEVLSNGKVSSSVIWDSFENTVDLERQRRIWDALDAEYGDKAGQYVGTLLAYTPAEWNVKSDRKLKS